MFSLSEPSLKMNSSSSTIIEQIEDERSLTDSLINELLLLRQQVNINPYTNESIDSDRIHEVNKRLDALEMRILRIEESQFPGKGTYTESFGDSISLPIF